MSKQSKADMVHDLVNQSLSSKVDEVAATQSEPTKTPTKAATKSTKTTSKSPKKSAVKHEPKKQSQTNLAPDKLVLLITIVNREKSEFYLDLIQSFQSNLQLSFSARGTASKAMGLLTPDREKAVLFSVLTRENAKLALYTLNKKFESIRGGKGVALTVPMTSTIGVAIYRFLCNR